MAQFVAVLTGGSRTEVDAALESLVNARINAARRLQRRALSEIALFPRSAASDPNALRFEFFAGFHQNPTRMAFLVGGAVIPVTMMVIIVGVSGLHRQHGEQACIQRAGEITDRRIRLLKEMHRREGHQSPALQGNLDTIIRAGDAAERRCRSQLDRFHYKVTVPPGFTFEIALGDSPSVSSETSGP